MAPTGLEVVPYTSSIKLLWDPSPDAISYLLQLDGAPVGTTSSTTYTFTNLNPLSSFRLGVAVVYPEGTSSYSDIQASTTIPQLIVYQPEDMDLTAGASQLYSFKPATTGIYRIYTGKYVGTGAAVDTEISIYSNLQLTKEIAYNDDANNTVFSEIEVNLVGGQTYYVKISGFDTTRLRARVTAEVVTSTIPYIQLDIPVNINQQAGNSNVYVFVPPANGQYRLATSPYNGSANSRANDTKLNVFSNTDMDVPITGGYNDDHRDSIYSEVAVNLSAGAPYYIRVDAAGGDKVYARLLVTSIGQTGFTPLQNGVAVDLSKPSGEDAYFQFSPMHSGLFRFFTSNYQGTPQLNDTEIELYSDIGLQNLLDINDDAKGYKPYGELFSKLEVNLSAGTTYYLVVRSAVMSDMMTRFIVEDTQQSNASSARVIPWGETIDADLSGNPLQITSLYDVDYYRIQLSNPEQISLYLSEGEGSIEDSMGNIRGYFSLDGQMSFDLDAGIYYLRVENDSIHERNRTPAWNFQGYTYELSADINDIEYVQGTYGEESAFRLFSANEVIGTFDATPGAGGFSRVFYNNKKNSSNLKIEIFTSNNIKINEYSLSGNYSKNEATEIIWGGSIANDFINKPIFANYADFEYGVRKFWAKSGVYNIVVSRMDGSKNKDKQSFKINVFNDPLNVNNVIPPLPKKNDRNKIITASDINNCEVCYKSLFKKPTIPEKKQKCT